MDGDAVSKGRSVVAGPSNPPVRGLQSHILHSGRCPGNSGSGKDPVGQTVCGFSATRSGQVAGRLWLDAGGPQSRIYFRGKDGVESITYALV